MRYEDVQVEMAGERVKKGVEGAFIPPPRTQSRAVEALGPGVSGVNPEIPGSPETPGKTRILRLPRSAPKKRSP
jgi:hypothetical protein